MRRLMSISGEKPSDVPFQATGHSAQYQTLGRALQLAVDAFDADWKAVQAKGYKLPTLSLRDEARMITIVVLVAAVCESVANTILATLLPPEEFNVVEYELRTTPKKWRRVAMLLTAQPILPETTDADLVSVFAIRDSIMHAKAQIRGADGNEAHPGNAQPWTQIDHDSVRRFATLPVRLLAIVPDTAPLLVRMIGISLRNEL